jgi:NADPH:quinone reductase-like Zn-dependent oxidoreductase
VQNVSSTYIFLPPDEGRRMQAVRYHEHGDVDVLSVKELPRPTPGSRELLVEMRAVSVNPVDAKFRSGAYGSVSLPAVPGGDGAGVVVEVGDAIEAFEGGDRVFVSGMGHADGGTTAEYAAIPVWKVAHLPESVSLEVGGAIGNVGATAWITLESVAGLQTGDWVLVHGGAGGVGHVAVQLAASAGADVVATAGSDAARDRVGALGAVSALEYASDTLAAEVRTVTGEAGVDVILDHMLGEHLETDLEVLGHGGQIVTIMSGSSETDATHLWRKEATIHGVNLGERPERRSILERIARLLGRGELTVEIADVYDLDDIRRAHRAVVESGHVGKVIVTP